MRRTIGGLLIGLAAVVFLAPLPMVWWRPEFDVSFMFWVWLVAGLLAFVGRRLTVRPATEVLAEDGRPPVLYLRPFQRDRRDSMRMLLRLITRNRELGGRSPEEEVIADLGDIGPVVAVGRPGEWLAPVGASRLYVPDDGDWRATVRSLMHDAQLVAIRGSGSRGLLWEIREAIATVEPGRVRLVFDAPVDYERFYEWAWSLFPMGLPASFPGRSLGFSDDWSPIPSRSDGVEPGASVVRPLSALAAVVLGGAAIVAAVALGFVITADSRDEVSGWLYAIVAVAIVSLLAAAEETVAMMALETNMRGLLTSGLRAEPPPRLLDSAVRVARSSRYVLPEHMDAALQPARDLEGSLIAALAPAGEAAAEVDPLPLRAAFTALGRADMLSARLASLSVLTAAVLATAAATGRLSWWAVVLAVAALGAAAGPTVGRRSCGGSLLVVYWTGEYRDLGAADRSILDAVHGKPIRVSVRAGRGCVRTIASRFVRLSALTAATHLLLLPLVFAGAWVLVVLWPGGTALDIGDVAASLIGTALSAMLYIGAGWLAALASAGAHPRGPEPVEPGG